MPKLRTAEQLASAWVARDHRPDLEKEPLKSNALLKCTAQDDWVARWGGTALADDPVREIDTTDEKAQKTARRKAWWKQSTKQHGELCREYEQRNIGNTMPAAPWHILPASEARVPAASSITPFVTPSATPCPCGALPTAPLSALPPSAKPELPLLPRRPGPVKDAEAHARRQAEHDDRRTAVMQDREAHAAKMAERHKQQQAAAQVAHERRMRAHKRLYVSCEGLDHMLSELELMLEPEAFDALPGDYAAWRHDELRDKVHAAHLAHCMPPGCEWLKPEDDIFGPVPNLDLDWSGADDEADRRACALRRRIFGAAALPSCEEAGADEVRRRIIRHRVGQTDVPPFLCTDKACTCEAVVNAAVPLSLEHWHALKLKEPDLSYDGWNSLSTGSSSQDLEYVETWLRAWKYFLENRHGIAVDSASIERKLAFWRERCAITQRPCSRARLSLAGQTVSYPRCSFANPWSPTTCKECVTLATDDGNWLFAQLEEHHERAYQRALASHRVFTSEGYQRCAYISREDRREARSAPEPERTPPLRERWTDEAGEWCVESLRQEVLQRLMATRAVKRRR